MYSHRYFSAFFDHQPALRRLDHSTRCYRYRYQHHSSRHHVPLCSGGGPADRPSGWRAPQTAADPCSSTHDKCPAGHRSENRDASARWWTCGPAWQQADPALSRPWAPTTAVSRRRMKRSRLCSPRPTPPAAPTSGGTSFLPFFSISPSGFVGPPSVLRSSRFAASPPLCSGVNFAQPCTSGRQVPKQRAEADQSHAPAGRSARRAWRQPQQSSLRFRRA